LGIREGEDKMPLPTTKDVSKVIDFLKKEKPGLPQKRKVAMALKQTGKSKFDKGKKKKLKKIGHHSQWF
jgi:hypothetical protein